MKVIHTVKRSDGANRLLKIILGILLMIGGALLAKDLFVEFLKLTLGIILFLIGLFMVFGGRGGTRILFAK